MKSPIHSYLLVSAIGLTLSAASLQASTIYFANWTAATLSSTVNGSASGTIATPQGTVNISYSGDVATQTQVSNVGYDYFTYYPAVYTNATVANTPPSRNIIALSQSHGYVDTLIFSAPVLNPILDIATLGAANSSISYLFNATPIILSQGPVAYGGCSTCLTVNGNTLTGQEGDGVIEFLGNYTQLSWTTTGSEAWNGFTVGVAGLGSGDITNSDTTATPEPATWSFLLAAFLLTLPALCGRSKHVTR
jgi:hypothetical protein